MIKIESLLEGSSRVAKKVRSKRRTPNTEHRTLNVEQRTLNAEHRTPNAQRPTLNAQRSTLNAEGEILVCILRAGARRSETRAGVAGKIIAKTLVICCDLSLEAISMNLRGCFCYVLLFVAPVFTISAGNITVPNFSFESPALSSGANNNGGNGDTTSITSWTIAAPAGNTDNGVYHPSSGFSSTNPLPAPADGNQLAYMVPGAENTSSITTSASLGTVAANTLYTLTVALGNRSDNLFFDTGTYTIDILANGVSVGENMRAGSTVAHGTFSDLSATFTSPASGPVIGESLTVRLSATAGSNSDEGIFDNVRLTATAVPEPAIPTMIIAGMAVLGWPRKRRRQK